MYLQKSYAFVKNLNPGLMKVIVSILKYPQQLQIVLCSKVRHSRVTPDVHVN